MNINLRTRIWKKRQFYLLMLPAFVYMLIFNYVPMGGVLIAFKNYKASIGIWDSKWVGLRNFKDFFESYLFGDLLRNTFVLSIYNLLVCFPMPIFIALLLNETRPKFKRTVQTVIYAPHFVSTVVLVGLMSVMFSPSQGVVNALLNRLDIESIYFMGEARFFRHMYVWSGLWQSMGWSAIIYIAALAGVDPNLHEAADIDGANRLQKIWHINIPIILPTVMIQLILQMGKLATVGYEKIYLMQNDLNIDVSEVISTFVYKRGIINASYSYSTAVDLFNNVVNIILLLLANSLSKKTAKTSLF